MTTLEKEEAREERLAQQFPKTTEFFDKLEYGTMRVSSMIEKLFWKVFGAVALIWVLAVIIKGAVGYLSS